MEEPLAQSIFVFFLGRFGVCAGVFFLAGGILPLVNLGECVIDRREGFFVPDCCDPFVDGALVAALHCVQFGMIFGHTRTPADNVDEACE